MSRNCTAWFASIFAVRGYHSAHSFGDRPRLCACRSGKIFRTEILPGEPARDFRESRQPPGLIQRRAGAPSQGPPGEFEEPPSSSSWLIMIMTNPRLLRAAKVSPYPSPSPFLVGAAESLVDPPGRQGRSRGFPIA